jgi:hypothetical protein
VKLDNPLLLNECYIGSGSEPVSLALTTGTTNPPAPNTQISGSRGTLSTPGHGEIDEFSNSSLVDNAFSVPGANGCAGPLAPVVDPSVDLQAGLPSAAGHNTAILTGTVELTAASLVKAQATLPELGRCQKTTAPTGGFGNSNCVLEVTGHTGPFEWTPGPGPNRKFTGTDTAVTIETVHKSRVKCAASTSAGEYTGTKTATFNVRMTECEHTPGKEACQSTGANAGEIVASPLEGKLGFVTDAVIEGVYVVSVGWDLKHEPSLLTAECGGAKQSLLLTGSAIGPISSADKMVSSYSVKFKALAGKQLPEQFEGGAKDTLTSTFGSTAEQAGLATSEKLLNEEKVEIKGEVE